MPEVIATATIREARRYTLTIYDDAGGSAIDERVDVSIGEGITWGDLQREARPGVLPSRMDLTLYDPPAAVEARIDTLTGTQEVPVVIERADQAWQWRGFIQPQPRSRSINPRLGVPEVTLEVVDGLELLKEAPGAFERLQSVGGAFFYANSALEAFVYLATDHRAGQSADPKTTAHLDEILYADRIRRDLQTWRDLLDDVCRRYNAVAFLDPTDIVELPGDVVGRGPRWHLEFLGTLGLPVDGYAAETGILNLGALTAETIAADTVAVDLGDLAVDTMRPLRSAVARRTTAELPSPDDNDPPALVLSGEDALRDGFFQYQTNTDEPLYAESILGTVEVIPNRIHIQADMVQNGEWVSEFFYVNAPAIAVLTYDAELTGSDLTVTLRVNKDGGGTDSVTGGTGLPATLQLDIDTAGELQVVVNADDAQFGEATLEVYRVDPTTTNDYITSITYRAPEASYLDRDVDPLVDMELLSVSDYDTANSASGRVVAPASRYINAHLSEVSRSAAEYSAEMRRLLRPLGVETILATYIDPERACLSPRTRLVVEVQGEDVPLVPAGGRRMDLVRGVTEIADISTPIDSVS